MPKVKPAPARNGANGVAHDEKPSAVRHPAYFMSLSLENVRCFGPKQTLDLSDGHGKPAPWTIILGLNGTGKTTILQTLVLGESFASLGPTFLGQLRPKTVHEILEDIQKGWLEDFQRAGCRSLNICSTLAAGSRLAQLPTREIERVIAIGRRSQHHDRVSIDPGDEGVKAWCFAYGAGRRVGSASFSEAEFEDRNETLFSDSAELRNPEEWLLRLDYAAEKESSSTDEQGQRLEKAKDLLLRILPDIEDIRLTTSKGPNPKPRAEFKTPFGWVPLRQLGYGYQTLITWVADLANRMAERYPDSKNPLAEPAVVLVDEIDLHLHPVWQRKLMGFLTERFPNTQFIATAHSPLVAQAAADANLAVLRREGDHVVIDQELGNIHNWRIDQILTSELFGLETARPPQIEAKLAERAKLLSKAKRTAKDEKRIQELEAEIGELPFGETPQEMEDREQIRKTLDLLMKERAHAK